ncbi:MAG: alpha/beta fold hydrolase, partial [Planctomycetota bacterium]|jgi:pimeloyl-ACP methyl ester carboxylesterase
MRRFSFRLLVSMLLLLLCVGCAHKQENQVLSSDNIAVSYNVQGKGTPALVFVHGWSCDKSYWKFQIPYFAKRYTVVAIDLAGHGKSASGRKEWTMQAFGSDVTAVIEKLDLDNVILIGHSMGGAVTIEAARQMPRRIIGRVGVDTFLDIARQHTPEQVDAILNPYKENFADSTAELVHRIIAPQADPDLVEWIITDMSSAPPEVGIAAMKEYLNFNYKQALMDVRKPIVCINSDKRPTNLDAARMYASSFKLKLVSGVGHFPMMEDPETFNRLLEETINELR